MTSDAATLQFGRHIVRAANYSQLRLQHVEQGGGAGRDHLQRPVLLAYARRMVGDDLQAEDILQDAWIRLKGLSPRAQLDQPGAYVRTVIRNLALDRRRAATREGRRTAGNLDLITGLASAEPDAETVLQGRQDLQAVTDALSELPERVGLAVRLHRLEGLKLKQIAQRLGVSTATAHGLVAEGLLHCARRLARRELKNL